MANFPKLVAIFNANWIDAGLSEEYLRISWNYAGNAGEFHFRSGQDIFLENPANTSQIPDQQLISSISMGGILAGKLLPGTQEYFNAMTIDPSNILDQRRFFQTIIGDVQLKTVTPVDDLSQGPQGTVFDMTFNKKNSANNTKTIRTDAWTLSDYDNRVNAVPNMLHVVPGAVHTQFGFKLSQLGAAGSANRQSVVDFIATRKFWV